MYSAFSHTGVHFDSCNIVTTRFDEWSSNYRDCNSASVTSELGLATSYVVGEGDIEIAGYIKLYWRNMVHL